MKDPKTDIIEDLSLLTPGSPYWWVPWAIVAFIALAVAGFFIFRLYQKKALPFVNAPVSSHRAARDSLASIRHLLVEGLHREFVTEASKILRYYIEEQYSVTAPHLSTEEFLFEAEKSDKLPASERETLANFLKQCDAVKFALGVMALPQMEELYKTAEKFIDDTALSAEKREEVEKPA